MNDIAASPVLELDVGRLRRERYAKLQAQMAADGLDALVPAARPPRGLRHRLLTHGRRRHPTPRPTAPSPWSSPTILSPACWAVTPTA